jgi:hypothetical protein
MRTLARDDGAGARQFRVPEDAGDQMNTREGAGRAAARALLLSTAIFGAAAFGSRARTPPGPLQGARAGSGQSATSSSNAAADGRPMPAFPGAEGFGADTPGGRGGHVLRVANLNDSGAGSLREALSVPGPRIVVFLVSGTIVHTSPLKITEPYVTVAGQTAPGDGIALAGEEVRVQTHDVVLRHVRIRTGDVVPPADGWTNRDALNLGAPGRPAHDVVIDHCSFSWSVDELVSIWYGSHDVTIQWSILSEALLNSRHPKGPHSMGLLAGDGATRLSIHHNLLAHNNQRNPELDGIALADVRNNVVYNWGEEPALLDSRGNRVNFVGNCYRTGPDAFRSFGLTAVRVDPVASDLRLFIERNRDPTLGPSDDNWGMVLMTDTNRPPPDRSMQALELHPVPPMSLDAAALAAVRVLADAGAARPTRDLVDHRVVRSAWSRTGRIIDSPSDVGGWPALRSAPPPKDSDRDGMPDWWERAHGLNPREAADGAQDRDGDGYTNVEEYLNVLGS